MPQIEDIALVQIRLDCEQPSARLPIALAAVRVAHKGRGPAAGRKVMIDRLAVKTAQAELLTLFAHCENRAASRAAWIAGSNNATRMPMIVITTRSHERKPRRKARPTVFRADAVRAKLPISCRGTNFSRRVRETLHAPHAARGAFHAPYEGHTLVPPPAAPPAAADLAQMPATLSLGLALSAMAQELIFTPPEALMTQFRPFLHARWPCSRLLRRVEDAGGFTGEHPSARAGRRRPFPAAAP